MALIPGNLLSENNQSVETSVGGWASFSSVSSGVIQSGTQHFDGTKSVQSTANAGTAGALGGLVTTVDLPVVRPGTAYTYSYFVFSPKKAIYNANLDWYQANNTTFVSSTNSSGQEVPVNSWSQITVSGIAPALSGLARMYLQVTSGLAAADVIFFDQMFFGQPVAAEIDQLFRPNGPIGLAPWEGTQDSDHSVIANAGVASIRILVPASSPMLLLALTSERGASAKVNAADDPYAVVPPLLTPDDVTGGMQPWTGAPDSITISATTATAGVAAVTMTAPGPVAAVGALPGTATTTVAADAPAASVGALPGVSAVTVAADAPVAGVGALPGAAFVTAAAKDTTTALGIFPGAAAIIVAADSPAGGVGAQTGTAAVAMAALAPSAALSALPVSAAVTVSAGAPAAGLTVLPGAANVIASGQSPTASLGALPGTAAVSTVGDQPVPGDTALPGMAVINMAALDASTVATDGQIAALPLLFLPDDPLGGMLPWIGADPGIITGNMTVVAGVASVIVSAQGPSAALTALPGTATMIQSAVGPSAGLSALPGTSSITLASASSTAAVGALPGTATASVTARAPSTGLAALPGVAPVNIAALIASVSGSITATAGVASMVMAARSPVADVGARPTVASMTTAALGVSSSVGAKPSAAMIVIAAIRPAVILPQAATPTVISGREPDAALHGRETPATFTGRDPGPVYGRQPLSSTSGTEPDNTISGQEP